MKLHATRLTPGTDLKSAITEFVKANHITAGAILSGVGSLSSLNIRLAGAQPDHQPSLEREEEFEIVSLNGTVGLEGMHLHISVSDREGNVVGGHLKDGCIVKTTVELVIIADPDQRFNRHPDPETGFDELVVKET
jgi:predicted DNA-binding protein with PD1-like motif